MFRAPRVLAGRPRRDQRLSLLACRLAGGHLCGRVGVFGLVHRFGIAGAECGRLLRAGKDRRVCVVTFELRYQPGFRVGRRLVVGPGAQAEAVERNRDIARTCQWCLRQHCFWRLQRGSDWNPSLFPALFFARSAQHVAAAAQAVDKSRPVGWRQSRREGHDCLFEPAAQRHIGLPDRGERLIDRRCVDRLSLDQARHRLAADPSRFDVGSRLAPRLCEAPGGTPCAGRATGRPRRSAGRAGRPLCRAAPAAPAIYSQRRRRRRARRRSVPTRRQAGS